MRVIAADKLRYPESEFNGERLEQFRRLEASSGPQDPWRVLEDRAATKGQSLSARARESLGVDPEVAHLWFNGINLTFTEEPPVVVLPDYPSVAEPANVRPPSWIAWRGWARSTGTMVARVPRICVCAQPT